MYTFSKSGSCSSSPKLGKPVVETSVKYTGNSFALEDVPRLRFLDQTHPEPQLLEIECERLRANRPFVRAVRDPANLGMGFAPSVLRQRSPAFVNIPAPRPFQVNWDKHHNPLTTFDMPFKI